MSDYISLPRLDPIAAEDRRRQLLAEDSFDVTFSESAVQEALTDPHAFPATGGRRIKDIELSKFRARCIDLANSAMDLPVAGFAQSADMQIGRLLFSFGKDSIGDMGHPLVWDFLTLILLPDIAVQRIVVGRKESELGRLSMSSRLTGGDRRHVFQRLWRRWSVFGAEMVESRVLTEDDYVATLERRLTLEQGVVAGRVASAILRSGLVGSARREYTRTLMRNLVALSGVVHIGEDDPDHLDAVFVYLHEQTVDML